MIGYLFQASVILLVVSVFFLFFAFIFRIVRDKTRVYKPAFLSSEKNLINASLSHGKEAKDVSESAFYGDYEDESGEDAVKKLITVFRHADEFSPFTCYTGLLRIAGDDFPSSGFGSRSVFNIGGSFGELAEISFDKDEPGGFIRSKYSKPIYVNFEKVTAANGAVRFSSGSLMKINDAVVKVLIA